MVESGHVGMPVFLFSSMLANMVFLVRACKDACATNRAIAGGPAVAILACAISELIWCAPPCLALPCIASCALLTARLALHLRVVPCFVQCAIVLFAGDEGEWSPRSRTGCDIMGLYSQLGSLCSMLATLQVGVITYRVAHNKQLPSRQAITVTSVSIFLLCTIISLLPLAGATKPYALSDGGFCYIDWYDPPQAIVMLLICLPTTAAVLALYGGALRTGEWEKPLDLLLLILGFLSAWVLWPPASIIGLARGTFPPHYMIAGGVLGHAQALINPYLYGVRWRNALVRHAGLVGATKPDERALELASPVGV